MRFPKPLLFVVIGFSAVALLLILLWAVGDEKRDENKQYIGKSTEECALLRFSCVPGSGYFIDEQGCGCMKEDSDNADNSNNSDDEPVGQGTACLPQQRGVQVCAAVYRPVCGWFDSEQIQCIRYPCAQTYGNDCEACSNRQVAYWTDGECPA